MGSKRYRNKVCAYCEGVSETRDHVVARNFFPESLRHNLPQVPACANCNGAKSRKEHYLVSVLPMAARNSPVLEALRPVVGRRLANNSPLADELSSNFRRLENESAKGWSSKLRSDEFTSYGALVAQGLLFNHFGVALSEGYIARGTAISHGNLDAVDNLFSEVANLVTPVYAEHADGALIYRGFALNEDPRISMWQVRLYGGLFLANRDPATANGVPCDFWAITSTK